MGSYMSTEIQRTSESNKPATIGELAAVNYNLQGQITGLLWFIIIVLIIVIIMAWYLYGMHKKNAQMTPFMKQ